MSEPKRKSNAGKRVKYTIFAIIVAALAIFGTLYFITHANPDKGSKANSRTTVFRDAKELSAYWLYQGGVSGATKCWNAFCGEEMDTTNIDDYERIRLLSIVNGEIRYDSLNSYAINSGCKTIIDIDTGFTPRAAVIGRSGVQYIGLGERNVIEKLNIAYENLVSEKTMDHIEFYVASGTSSTSMEDISKQFDGEVCIIAKGVFSQLDEEGQIQMFENCKLLLEAHGGCIVTSDYVAADILGSVAGALYGASDGAIVCSKTKSLYTEAIGANMRNPFELNDKSRRLIESLGLQIEVVQLYQDLPDLKCFELLTEDQIAALREAVPGNEFWVITLAPSEPEPAAEEAPAEDAPAEESN